MKSDIVEIRKCQNTFMQIHNCFIYKRSASFTFEKKNHENMSTFLYNKSVYKN